MLLRKKLSKGRYTYKLNDRIRKIWVGADWEKHLYTSTVQEHIDILHKIFPGYLLDYGYFNKHSYFIDYKFLPGTSIMKYKHTPQFIEKFRRYCIDNVKETFPYSHSDWTLANVLEHEGKWTLVDWDTVGKRSITQVQRTINHRLKGMFGYKVNIVQKRELSFMEKY